MFISAVKFTLVSRQLEMKTFFFFFLEPCC